MNIKKSIYKFLKKIKCRLTNGKKILVLGDSHAGVFEFGFDNNLLKKHYLSCEIVAGATAYGLGNEKSATRSRDKFEAGFSRCAEFDVVFIMLGEVDCSVTLWLLGCGINKSVTDCMDVGVNNIFSFVNWIKKKSKEKIIVLVAAPLPSVKDNDMSSQGLDLRRQVKATQSERTKLVIQYNQRLHDLARRNGLLFLDVTDDLLDKKTGLLAEYFCREGVIDHHHSFERTAKIWCDKINEILD